MADKRDSARLEPLNPIEKVLRDLAQMRGTLTTDLLRLPAPDPFKSGLGDVDKLLERLEDDIQSIHGRTLQAVLGGQPRFGRFPRGRRA